MPDTTTTAGGAAAQSEPGPYGLPAALFERLWSIDDVCRFLRVERTKARELLASEGAPPRMQTGSKRCDRWNPVLVVAWLHGDDWRLLAVPVPRPLRPVPGAVPDAPDGSSWGEFPDASTAAATSGAASSLRPLRGRPPGRPFAAGAASGGPR